MSESSSLRERSAEERGHLAACRVFDNMPDIGRTDLVRPSRQRQFFTLWRELRSKCYDFWMDDLESDRLMKANDELRELISRCTKKISGPSNHIAVVGPCHEEIIDAFERCRDLSGRAAQRNTLVPE
mmetsp:Transcript_100677/g.314714  ORF Transcript_100677/g.314714 Transcript_100677/m.314714 type:complete len:127 (+) Transcript_100677:116-496(+)